MPLPADELFEVLLRCDAFFLFLGLLQRRGDSSSLSTGVCLGSALLGKRRGDLLTPAIVPLSRRGTWTFEDLLCAFMLP